MAEPGPPQAWPQGSPVSISLHRPLRRGETFIYLFIWLCWIFVAVRRLSLVVVSRGYSLLRCAGFSLRWLLLLQSTGSRHMGSSCGAQALLLRGMWDPPGPGLEPVSPALAGGFLTTAPPGKPSRQILNRCTTREVPRGKVLRCLIQVFIEHLLHA